MAFKNFDLCLGKQIIYGGHFYPPTKSMKMIKIEHAELKYNRTDIEQTFSLPNNHQCSNPDK